MEKLLKGTRFEKLLNGRSPVLLVSVLIGLVYVLYCISYWMGDPGMQKIDIPGVYAHVICTILALLFNIAAWALNYTRFAAATTILYVIAIILYPPYAKFVGIQCVLSFIGIVKLSKRGKANGGARNRTMLR